MSNMSRKQKSYSEKVESGQKLIALWLDLEKWELIKKAAESVQEPMTTWIRRAIFASLRKWEVPEPKFRSKLFEPCSVCGERHDKNEHFQEE